MNKTKLAVAMLFLSGMTFAQGIYNNGANIVVSSGTYLVIDGNTGGLRNETNTNDGVIDLTGKLKLGGNFTNNVATSDAFGTLASGSEVIFAGTGTQNIGGTSTAVFNFDKLTVNSGSTVEVSAGKHVTTAGVLANAGTFTLKSDAANGNATLLTEGAISGAGTYNAEQYLQGAYSTKLTGRSYYISSPVASAKSSVFSPNGDDLKMQSYSEASNTFNSITGDETALNPMEGYFARIGTNTTKTFTGGAFNDGTMNDATLTRRTTGSAIQQGFNLVGNPYPSYLDWADVYAASTDLETTIWYRTASANTVGGMCFDTYNLTGPASTNNNLGGAVTAQIPPCQAFWIRVIDTKTTGNIVFNNTMRSHQTGHLLKSNNETPSLLRLAINEGSSRDETLILFNENATDDFEAYDSEKMMGTNSAQCYTSNNEGDMAINTFAPMNETKSVPVGVSIVTEGTHSFSVNENTIDLNTSVILEDKATGTFTDLRSNPTYSFTAKAGSDENRFVVHFNYKQSSVEDSNPSEASSIFSFNKSVCVNAVNSGKIEISDMTGRIVLSQSVNAGMNTVNIQNAGVYIVKLVSGNEVKVNKIVI